MARVIHDTGGLFSQGDVTDRPCPAITISIKGLNSSHYLIETGGGSMARQNRSVTLERPEPAVLTHGRLHTHSELSLPVGEIAPPAASTKPPYRVPSMVEIAAVPWNGKTVVSTFSGCGGSCLGFKMAGYRVLWASEFIPAAAETYRANHPNTPLDVRDIRMVSGKDILEAAGLERGDVDVMEGSPPCASFSTAGKRSDGWGQVKAYSDTRQRVDDLFFEYARLVGDVEPRMFVAENVSGLVKGVAKGYFKEILAALKATGPGYTVEARLLDAQWLGVPQMRQRIIFVGVRSDLVAKYGVRPLFPKPLPYRYTVREALPWIMRQGDNGGFGGGAMRETTAPSPTIGTGTQAGNGRFPPAAVEAEITGRTGHGFRRVRSSLDEPVNAITVSDPAQTRYEVHGVGLRPKSYASNEWTGSDSPAAAVNASGQYWVEPEADLADYAIGKEWDKIGPGERSDRYYQLERADPAAPSPTIAQRGGDGGDATVTHPTERRKFTIAELRRICAFPDDFVLTGTYAQQWERLGRAVPPVMMRAVAEQVLLVLNAAK